MNLVSKYYAVSSIHVAADSIIAASWVLFLMSRGYTFWEVGLSQAAFFLVSSLVELPSGMLADRFGRRPIMVIGCVTRAVGNIIYVLLSGSLSLLVAAAVVSATGSAFASGTLEAWMVDELKHQGKDNRLSHIFSTEGMISIIVSGIAGFVGAEVLAYDAAVGPFELSAACLVLCAGTSIFLMNEFAPRVQETFELGYHGFQNFQRAITDLQTAWKSIATAPMLVSVIGVSMAVAFCTQGPGVQWQPYFSHLIGDDRIVGLLWVGISLAGLLGYRLVRLIPKERAVGGVVVSSIVNALCITASVIIKSPMLAMLSFFAHVGATSFGSPLRGEFVNNHIEGSNRATVLSFRGVGVGMSSVIGLLILGRLSDAVSIEISWAVGASVLVVAALYLLWATIRRPRELRDDVRTVKS